MLLEVIRDNPGITQRKLHFRPEHNFTSMYYDCIRRQLIEIKISKGKELKAERTKIFLTTRGEIALQQMELEHKRIGVCRLNWGELPEWAKPEANKCPSPEGRITLH